MRKFTFHLVTAAALGALAYATVPVEAETPTDAHDKLVEGLKDGSIKPDFREAGSPLDLSPTSEGGPDKAFVAGFEDHEDEGGNEVWPGQGQGGRGGQVKASGAGTSPVGGSTLPLNNDGAAAGHARNIRNMAPLDPAPIAAGAMPPAKMRPGELPLPRLGDGGDPEKSPTPAADGVTHLPASQRSQAIPTPGRTLGMRGIELGRDQGRDMADLDVGAARQTSAQSETLDTGGPTPAQHEAEGQDGEMVGDEVDQETAQEQQTQAPARGGRRGAAQAGAQA